MRMSERHRDSDKNIRSSQFEFTKLRFDPAQKDSMTTMSDDIKMENQDGNESI